MNKIIDKTINYVKSELKHAESGHDWWHTYRVWKAARFIAQKESCNLFVVEMGALLHDIADSKFFEGNEEIGPEKAKAFLNTQKLASDDVDHIIQIIKNVSFKGGNFKLGFNSVELQIVQDADRLDAIGAIGIARTFNYGGYKNREIYNPEIQPNLNMSKNEYKSSKAPTINHFYEKLLLLKDKMNTDAGRKLANERHAFLEMYLKQFYKEWNAEFI